MNFFARVLIFLELDMCHRILKCSPGNIALVKKSGHNSASSLLISSVDWPIRHGNCLIINLFSVLLILSIDVIRDFVQRISKDDS